MRRLLLVAALIATALAAGTAPTDPKQGSAVPRKAAEFVFQMVDGPRQLLSIYKGKTVVLALMYTTCDHCQKTAAVLAKVQSEYAAKGVQVLGAVFDDGAACRPQQFHESLGLNFPVGYPIEDKVLELVQPAERPYHVPILVFIDKRGIIRSLYIGKDVNIRAGLDKMLTPPKS